MEDDEQLVEVLKAALSDQYVIDIATNGQEGWELLEAIEYDLVLLDIVLPKLDGIDLCRQLRAKGNQVLVMLLTAKGEISDRVAGLDAGADDYVVKPVVLQELEARIRALLRRKTSNGVPVLEYRGIRLDPSNCQVTYNDSPLSLSAKEYALLEVFLRNRQRMYSQSMLLNQLWSLADNPRGEETVRAHIKRLRQKLNAVGVKDLIETVYGLGYRLNPLFNKDDEATTTTKLWGATATSYFREKHQLPFLQQIDETDGKKIIPANQVAKISAAKILAVDDDRPTLDLLKVILEPWGLQVTTCSNSLKCMDVLETIQPDLLILDIQMPNLNGIDLCQMLRNNSRWSGLPLLMLTAHQDGSTIHQVFAAGADDYVSKPIVVPELITRVLNRLERRQLLRQQGTTTAFEPLKHLGSDRWLPPPFFEQGKPA